MYDAIVVGARCAGAPTAMLLARKGYRVLMVDQDSFPSDIMSTHVVWHEGVAQLARWGVLAKVVATNCPPIRRIHADFGSLVLSGTPLPVDGADAAYCPRRRLLDKILIDAAVDAGAEFREGFTVHELIRDGDTVTGLRGRSGGGPPIEEQARIVIGADGVHSTIARLVQAPEYEVVPGRSCGYYSYYSGIPVSEASVFLRAACAIYSFPTNDALTCIAIEWPVGRFHEIRADIEGSFKQALQLVPELAAAVDRAKREERFVGTGDLANFFRRPFGPGWAVVGDAGYHKDPVTGRGISDAFRDAGLLAEAIDAGFSGRLALDEALAGYETRRNQASMPMYQLTLQQVAYEPPPAETLALLAAISRSQEETDRFLSLVPGSVPIPDYFAPENVQRIISAAGNVPSEESSRVASSAAVSHRFVQTNGIRMHIAEQGAGPLVILCHGFPESWYSWRHQLSALASAGYHAVAPDQRGYGQTDAPAEPDKYTMLHLVGDIVGLLDALGEQTAVVVGHDWGAPVAWNAALMRPDRFRAVVGMSVPYLARGPFPPVQMLRQVAGENFYIVYFQRPGVAENELERDVRATVRRMLYTASGDAPSEARWGPVIPKDRGFLDVTIDPETLPSWLTEADVDFYAGEFSRTGFRGGLNWYRAMDLSWELTAPFNAAPIVQPSLFIAGKEDAVLSFPGMDAVLANLRQWLPGLHSTLFVDGCGHWVQQERPDEVNAALIDFLKKVEHGQT